MSIFVSSARLRTKKRNTFLMYVRAEGRASLPLLASRRGRGKRTSSTRLAMGVAVAAAQKLTPLMLTDRNSVHSVFLVAWASSSSIMRIWWSKMTANSSSPSPSNLFVDFECAVVYTLATRSFVEYGNCFCIKHG